METPPVIHKPCGDLRLRACSLSEPQDTMGLAKNRTTRTADCANSRHVARVWPPTSSEERKRLMLSIPPTPDGSSTCTSPHADGCPGCVANTEPPEHVERRPDGCSAFYRCNDCGHEWTTTWGCR